MRDINEQLSVIMHRADSIKEKESLRKYMVAQSLSLCACIALLVMTCCYLPRLTRTIWFPYIKYFLYELCDCWLSCICSGCSRRVTGYNSEKNEAKGE